MHKTVTRNALAPAWQASLTIATHRAGDIRLVLDMWSRCQPLNVTDAEAEQMRDLLDEAGATHVLELFNEALQGAMVLTS